MHLRAVVDRHVRFAPVGIAGPPDLGLDGGSGQPCPFGQREGGAEHRELTVGVVGRAQGVAQRQIGEDESRYPDLLDYVTGRSDDDGGDTGVLEGSCGQTDRLMTDRSERNEQHQVDVVLAGPVDELLRPEHSPAMAVVGGKSVEARRHPADLPGVGQGTELLEGKEAAEVVGVRGGLVP